MAEDEDRSNRTEDPTPRRLEEARRQGDVAKSIDLTSWSTLAGTAGALVLAGGWMAQDLTQRLLPFIERPDSFQLEDGGAVGVLRMAVMAAAPVLAVVVGAAAVSGIAGNVVQHGVLWTGAKLKPEFSKVSPLTGFKRLFGVDGLVQFLKSVLKVAITAAVAWWALKPHVGQLQNLTTLDPAAILPFSISIIRALAMAVIAILGVGALVDFIWQRQRFMSRMRMTREELKEDIRQSEGDPHMKARVRQLRSERARRRMIQQVPKATVVVTNPTHYAVALRYKEGETAAPVCLAKGADRVALRIREAAEAAHVPVVEDPPLARALYAAVELDQAIPVQHYEAAAKIIGFVMQAARRRRASGL